MRISEPDVSPVLDVARRSKPTDLYAGSTDEARAPHRDLLDADGMPGSAIGGYLVRDYGELVILADAGLGGHPQRAHSSYTRCSGPCSLPCRCRASGPLSAKLS